MNDISFDIRDGEIVALMGPNGCGKTTLLKIIAGFEMQSTGSILYNTHAIQDLRCGIVFQNTQESLFPWQTVERHLTTKPAPLMPNEALEALLKQLGLYEHRRKYPYQLSGGMAQLLAIGRAFAQAPQLFLLDEPFAALDYYTALNVQQRFLELWETQRTTTLVITHTLEEAIFLADRIIVFSEAPGRVVANIPIKLERPRQREIMANPLFHAIKTAALNALTGFLICVP